MRIDDRLADRQAESEAALCSFAVPTMELVEYALLLAGGQTRPAVGYAYLDAGRKGFHRDADCRGWRRMLLRIFHKVEKYLLDHHLVAAHQGQVGGNLERDA